MRSYHHYYHNRVYRAIHSDFWRLEFSIWLQTLAWSLVSIFIPILMLRYGYSLLAVIALLGIIFVTRWIGLLRGQSGIVKR